jgi:hypothetical protein
MRRGCWGDATRRVFLAGGCWVRHPVNRDAGSAKVAITHSVSAVPTKPMGLLIFISKNAILSTARKFVGLKENMSNRVTAIGAGWYDEIGGSGE